MKLKAIFFDFDGVIVNSRQATIEYFQETLRHFKLPVPKDEDFNKLLGLKTIDIVKNLLPNLSEEEIAPIFKYSKKMSLQYVPKIELVPQAHQVLTNLNNQYSLALITSRGKKTVQVLLEQYDLSKYFKIVIDREDVTQHKPHPEGIHHAMEELDIKLGEVIFIGDAKQDIEAAHNAQMPCILISDSKNTEADYNINKLADLTALIKNKVIE
jgi:pyrophosphatase PpaX